MNSCEKIRTHKPKIMKKSLLLAGFLFTLCALQAQAPVGLTYMDELWQSSLANPALQSEHRVVVILPSISNTLSFTGPTYGDAITDVNGNATLDVNAIIASLEDRNELREQFQIGTIGLSLQFGNIQVGLHHATRFDAFLEYPRELPALIWKGNAQYIGETIPLDNQLRIYGYHEVGLSGSVDLGKVQLGARVKYLSGIGDLSTSRSEASLYTDPEFYQLTLSSDYELQTASSLDYEAFNDFDLNFNFGQLSLEKLFAGNAGVAVDLGAQLDLGKLQLGASVTDLGGINWQKDVKIFSSQGSFTYEGLDIAQALTGDSVSFEQALDTLAQIFDFQQTTGTYSTSLPTTVYLTGSYQLSNMWSVGAVLSGAFQPERFEPVAAIFGKAEIGPWLRVGASYTVVQETFDNLGLSANLCLGPAQLYVLSDNVIALFQPEKQPILQFPGRCKYCPGKKTSRRFAGR
jgi:hypothetical protein